MPAEHRTLEPQTAPKVQILREPSEFPGLEADWNALLARLPGWNPFLSFDWMAAWLQAFGADRRLLVVVVRGLEGVEAIAPFCVDDAGLLTFLGYPQSDYADILVAPGCEAALDVVLGALYADRSWKRALLNQFPEENSHWREILARLRSQGRPHRLESGDLCPAMVLDDLEAARKQYYKRNITTYVNWYKQRGELQLTVYEDSEEALARLEDLFAQHILRWDGTPYPSSFLDPRMKDFYRAFLRAMHPKGMVRLVGLTLDDEFLALYLFMEAEETMYLYKTSYNLEYHKKSPGQVVLRYLFDYAVEHGVRKMDFVRGDEGYKARFANVSQRNQRILLYRSVVAAKTAQWFFDARYSKLADLLYRNRRVQAVRSRLLAALRNR